MVSLGMYLWDEFLYVLIVIIIKELRGIWYFFLIMKFDLKKWCKSDIVNYFLKDLNDR